jgi:DNA mismatch repair ATPase MutS
MSTENDHFAFYPRQSLKSAERFSSPYLLALEQSINQAQEEYQHCFVKRIQELVAQFLTFQSQRFSICDSVAQHDVAIASVRLIEQYRRSLPVFSSNSQMKVVG